MDLHQRPEATSTGPGGALDSKWVPPVGGAPSTGTPAPEVQAVGVHKEEPSGAPTQAARQAARPGDAEQPRRCAGRRAGVHRRGEDSPRRDQRISELDRCVLRQVLGDRLRRKRISSKKLRSRDVLAFAVSDKEQHASFLQPRSVTPISGRREEIRSASRVDRLWFSGHTRRPISVTPCRGFGVDRCCSRVCVSVICLGLCECTSCV
jgi:hypothetical protein